MHLNSPTQFQVLIVISEIANKPALRLLTFRRPIRSGHDDNTVQKQILKKLLEDHGVSDVSHLEQGKPIGFRKKVTFTC